MDPVEVKKVLNLTISPPKWNFGGDADRLARNGFGKERWDNKIVQKYQGKYREDCLHDNGKYNWGNICYEGKIYANNINGYGVMSYPDGSFFEGLYKLNQRFGPGILTYSDSSQDVGLWIGHQLIRLALNITEEYIPNIAQSFEAKAYINKYKKLIPISKPSSAPQTMLQELFSNQPPCYIKNLCNRYIRNQDSLFFDITSFDEAYFSNEKVPVIKSFGSSEPILKEEVVSDLLSWNNEIDQMELRKYIFDQRNFEHGLSYEVQYVLGDRTKFGTMGSFEKTCKDLLLSICNLDNKSMTSIVRYDLNPDFCDCLGNTAVHCSVASDNLQALKSLLNLGANLDRMNDECLTPLIICLLRFLEAKEHVTDWQSAFLPPLQNSDNLNQYVLDISCKVVLLPLKRKREKKKKEKNPKKEKKSKEKKGRKKKGDDSLKTPKEIELLPDPKLFTIFQTLATLLDYGTNPNVGEVPLPPIFLSLFTLDEAVVLNLIKHGADCNARTSQEDGFLTPLHVIAAMKPSPELPKLVKILVDNGAHPNLRSNITHWIEEKYKITKDDNCLDEGKTPLHLLSMRYDIVEDAEDLTAFLYDVLIESGCDPQLFYLGHNCLSLAILRGNVKLVKHMLEKENVNPNESLSCKMGVPITVLTLKRYKHILPLYACQDILDILVQSGANPLNFISKELQLNAITFCAEENKPEQTAKKTKVNKKEPHFKLIQYLNKLAQAILDRRVMAKAVEYLYNFKVMCAFSHPIFDKLIQMVNVEDTLRILKLFIGHDQILPMPDALVELLETINMLQSKKGTAKTPKSSRMSSRKFKSVSEDYNFTEIVQNLLEEPLGFLRKKYGNLEPEIDPDEEKYKICYNCLRGENNLILCPDCEIIYFCSESCNKSSLKKTTKHKCKNFFYAMERGKEEAGQKGKKTLQIFEERRQMMLANPLTDFHQLYLSAANLQDQDIKVKFALPDLSKIIVLPSQESKLFEMVGSFFPHLSNYRLKILELKESKESTEKRSTQSGSRSQKISKTPVSTPDSRLLTRLELKQDSSVLISKSDLDKSKSQPSSTKSTPRSNRRLLSIDFDRFSKTPSAQGSLRQKTNFEYHKSRKEYETIVMEKINICDAEICDATDKDLEKERYSNKTIRKHTKTSEMGQKDEETFELKDNKIFDEYVQKLKDISSGKLTNGRSLTRKGKVVDDMDKDEYGFNIAKQYMKPDGDNIVQTPPLGKTNTYKLKTIPEPKKSHVSKKHEKVIPFRKFVGRKVTIREKVSQKSIPTSNKSDHSHQMSNKFTGKGKDQIKSGLKTDMTRMKNNDVSSKSKKDKKSYSKKEVESKVSSKKEIEGRKYVSEKDGESKGNGKRSVGRVAGSRDGKIRFTGFERGSKSGWPTPEKNITATDIYGSRKVSPVRRSYHTEGSIRRLSRSKNKKGLNENVDVEGDSTQLKKLKLGDKISMSPKLISSLGQLLKNRKTALHTANLINGQLYYKFMKYKAYTNVGDSDNNFSYQ